MYSSAPEAALVLAAFFSSMLAPRIWNGVFRRLEQVLERIAQHRRLAIALVGLLALSLKLLVVAVEGLPEPRIHDEFSHLLAADTFSKGRLTNPTHPMWIHFETFHVDHKPTYMSMYPPAQGMVLAVGTLLGHPAIGAWLAAAALCATLTWMLQGWMPSSWALLGGFYSVLRLALFGYWVTGYHGGIVPAIGGALALGATGHLIRKPSALLGGAFAFGALILANSRPYEGFVVCGVMAVGLAWNVFRKGSIKAARYHRPLAAASLVFLLGGAWMAYYNWRVFGNSLTLPYTVNRATYAVTPVFAWQSPAPEPVYRHSVMRNFYLGWELDHYRDASKQGAVATRLALIAIVMWFYYVGPLLTLPLILGTPALLKIKRIRVPLMTFAFCVAAVCLLLFTTSHYVSPATGALYVLIVYSIRVTRLKLWRSHRAGNQFVRMMIIAATISAGLHIWTLIPSAHMPDALEARAQFLKKLENIAGQHLVLVRYSSKHDPLLEVVYNEADIDAAKVIWARTMDEAKDKELLDYFPNRNVWIFEPDQEPPQLLPFKGHLRLAKSP